MSDRLSSVDLDHAAVCACAYDPARLREVDPRWLATPGLSVILGAMRALHTRGEAIHFESMARILQGHEQRTRGGWWSGDWSDWWVVCDPVTTGALIRWPLVLESLRDTACRRQTRDAAMMAAAACETGELADVERALLGALRVVRVELRREGQVAA